MSQVAFPATEKEHFPSPIHSWLDAADRGVFAFPAPEDMVAPPLNEFSAKQERVLKFAYFNYWLAAMRVYYINAAWAYSFTLIDQGRVCGDSYVEQTRKINTAYDEAARELYIHYGYDYEGPPAR